METGLWPTSAAAHRLQAKKLQWEEEEEGSNTAQEEKSWGKRDIDKAKRRWGWRRRGGRRRKRRK